MTVAFCISAAIVLFALPPKETAAADTEDIEDYDSSTTPDGNSTDASTLGAEDIEEVGSSTGQGRVTQGSE